MSLPHVASTFEFFELRTTSLMGERGSIDVNNVVSSLTKEHGVCPASIAYYV